MTPDTVLTWSSYLQSLGFLNDLAYLSARESWMQPELRPTKPEMCTGCFPAGSEGSECMQIYHVFKPNKHFSKNKPDAPQLAVALAEGDFLPTFSTMTTLQRAVSPLPLQFARVSGGEVSFHSVGSGQRL